MCFEKALWNHEHSKGCSQPHHLSQCICVSTSVSVCVCWRGSCLQNLRRQQSKCNNVNCSRFKACSVVPTHPLCYGCEAGPIFSTTQNDMVYVKLSKQWHCLVQKKVKILQCTSASHPGPWVGGESEDVRRLCYRMISAVPFSITLGGSEKTYNQHQKYHWGEWSNSVSK